MLQAHTTALVDAHRVPARLQETLLGGVNQLAAQAPVCIPRVAPVATTPPAPTTTERAHHGHKHHGHGHGHDQGDEGGG
jgi:hypothetical protein